MSPLSKPAPDHVNTRMCLHWAAWASKFGPYNYKCEPAGGVGGVKVRLWSVGNNHCSPSSICGDISEWSELLNRVTSSPSVSELRCRQPEIVLNAQVPLSYKLLEVPVLLFFSVDPLLYRLSLPGVLALPLLIFPSFSSNSPFPSFFVLLCLISWPLPCSYPPHYLPGWPQRSVHWANLSRIIWSSASEHPPSSSVSCACGRPSSAFSLFLCRAFPLLSSSPSLFILSFLWRTRAQAQCGHNDDMTAAFR